MIFFSSLMHWYQFVNLHVDHAQVCERVIILILITILVLKYFNTIIRQIPTLFTYS